MPSSIVEYIAGYAQSQPDKAAIIAGDAITNYRRLWTLVCGFCDYLTEKGIKKGDVVVARATQTLSFAIAYWGTHLSGGIFAPVEKTIPNAALSEIVAITQSAFVVSDTDEELPASVLLVDVKEVERLALTHLKAGQTRQFPREEDSSDLLFTTGTTGKSKGVELSHLAITAVAENIIVGMEEKKNNVIALPGPLNHANAIRKLFSTAMNGSTIVILDGLMSMKAFYDALDRYGVTSMCLPPSALKMIFMMSKDRLADYRDQIDYVESGGAALPEVDRKRLCALLPNSRLYIAYGSSESGFVSTYDYNQDRGLINCVGKILPRGKVVVVDDQRNEIVSSPSRCGLIACGGDVNMKGYWKDDELTRQAMHGGLVYTNDIGYIADGYVYIIGRADDVINVGGLKVAPTDVEAKALEIQGINECICVPVRDALTGFATKLLVVMESGHAFDAREIARKLEQKLEKFKVPKIIEQVGQIAKTYNGKTDRKHYRIED